MINEIIRRRIGFDGFLMSDDIGMEALAGDLASRAAGVVAAGCDVRCIAPGRWRRWSRSPSAVPAMTDEGEARLARAMATTLVDDDALDFAEAIAKRDALLALV